MTNAQREKIAKALERAAAALRMEKDINLDWVAISPHGDGVEMYRGPKEAKEDAEAWCEPDGEWPEGIEDVSWGVYVPVEQVMQIDREETPENHDYDYTCNYILVDSHLRRA